MSKKLHPLRSYRRKNRLKAAQLAKTLGIAPSTLRSFENGNRTIDADWALEIEKRLGIDRSEIRPDLFETA
jgi:transcriptional regulator with XRE-family HTH domain